MRLRHSSASSHGQGAAPETAIRSEPTSERVNPGPSRMRLNIVATAGKTVTLSRRIEASAASGEKRSSRVTEAPVLSGARSAPFSPNEWERGSAARTTSSGVSAMTGSAHDRLAEASAACPMTAPLGRPVLPDV